MTYTLNATHTLTWYCARWYYKDQSSWLTGGLLLWVLYGVLKGDLVIVVANCVGAVLSGSVLAFKIRDIRAGRR